MNSEIKKKIIISLRNVCIIFPLILIIYFFCLEIGGNINLGIIFRSLIIEIVLGIFLVTIGYLLRYLRWRIILSRFGFYPSIKTESKIWLASYSFTVSPGKIGELVRCFFLKRIFNIPLTHSIIFILTERLLDLVAVLIFALSYFLIAQKNLRISSNFLFLIIPFFFLTLIFFKRINFRKLQINLFNLMHKFIGKGIQFSNFKNIEKINNLFRLDNLFILISLSLISWGFEGLAFFILLKNSGLVISYLSATFVHTISGLLGALSMFPGGLGPTEAITVSFLKLKNIPIVYGITITTIMRLITLWYITFLGMISLFMIRKKVF